jgi:hypothetical protein
MLQQVGAMVKRPSPGQLFALAVLAVLALQGFMLAYVTRHAPIFSGAALSWVDFSTHAEQTWRVTEALHRWGKSWLYDPQLLAGYPSGTVFDADNKGWELWTFALWRAGLQRATAFNLLVVFAHACVAPLTYAAGRLFRLDRWEALIAATLAMSVWFFDGLTRWCWYSGAIAFCLVSCTFVLPIGLLYRYLRSGRWPWAVALALALAAVHLMHPSAFVLLALPMLAMYVRAVRSATWRMHATLLAVALFTVGANAWWLLVTFRFSHYVTDHTTLFVGTSSFFLADYVEIVRDLNSTGLVSNRTGFRFVAWTCAGAGLFYWSKERDDRFMPVALGWLWLLGLAYLGGYFWLFRQVQQYRNVVPAAFIACIPAGSLLARLARSEDLRRLPNLAYVALGLFGLIAIPHLAGDVLYFFPKRLAEPPALSTGNKAPLSAFGFQPHEDIRHYPPKRDMAKVAEWVKAHDDRQGRFLVEWWVLAEFLLSTTDGQILGGFHEHNMQHAAANLFSKRHRGEKTHEHMVRYFEDYAIRWVILTYLDLSDKPYRDDLEFVEQIGEHRIYTTKVPVELVASGGGRVDWSMNRLDVAGSEPQSDVVLRYHWLETLGCEPGCRVEREPLDGDQVGFLRIPAPHPADFSVVNRYKRRAE